jgi:hypothetical protein
MNHYYQLSYCVKLPSHFLLVATFGLFEFRLVFMITHFVKLPFVVNGVHCVEVKSGVRCLRLN